MPQTIERVVACGRCDERAQFFRSLGFQVQDCLPHPERPGDCVLRMTDPALEAAPAPAALAVPAAVAMPPAAAALATPAGAPLTPLQARTAQAILNLLETSAVLGDYGQVTLIAGDTGHLTYGRSQTTLGSGNLADLIARYVANSGARFGARLAPYLPRLQATDLALDQDRLLHNLLRASADDPVMRDTQDSFFDQVYWQPALRAAAKTGLHTPLGVALAYDGQVHGSWAAMRDRTNAQVGAVAQAGERDWIARYITERRGWLAQHSRADLRATVYRMDTFQRLVDLGLWGLPLPMVVRGQEISTLTLNGLPPGCYDGPAPGTRALALAAPMQRGLDVRLAQLGLSERGVDLRADGIFGPGTRDGLLAFQALRGLPRTGALDASQVAELAA